MAAFHQRVQLEEAGTALDRMEPTENGIEQVHIVRPALQLDQLLGQLLENLAGLNQEVLEDFFIGVEAHSAAPRDVLLERIGRTAVLPEIPARLSGPTSARPPGSPA
ncbi:probable two-component sensor [Pseudomonas aeruginosa NCMG1179]|nr:probable two-component sensor [Pseudomonas aeruginosa NCMG1179]